MTTCIICGRELTHPASVASGIGPECRISHKNDDARQGNMFSSRAKFDYCFKDGVLVILDLGGGKTVTNDVDNVLRDILETEGSLDCRILYKDSFGLLDGINHKNGKFLNFYFVGGDTIPDAIKKIKTVKL